MATNCAAAQDEVARLNELLESRASHADSADSSSRYAAAIVDAQFLPDNCRLQHLSELLADAQLQVPALLNRLSPTPYFRMCVFVMHAAASKCAGATG
jgi:hypothetical protein